MIAPASSFIHPPTDGSVPLNHIVDFHLRYNPQHPWAVLAATEDHPEVTVTYEQLAHAVHRAAHIVNPGASIPQGTNVGILATADTIVYLTLILGVSRAGLVPFPISPRTQLAGITHLLTKSNTPHIIIGGSPAILGLRDNLVGSIDSRLNTISVPTLNDLYPELGKSGAQDFVPFPDVEPAKSDSIVTILHSSGSTGLPRPIPLHQEGVLCNEVQQPSIWEYGEPGQRAAFMALPSFHVMGYTFQYVGPLFAGYVPVLFAPSSPPTFPTAELTLQTLVRSGCMSLLTVPAFLETWARGEEAIKQLAKLKRVTFGGGSLARWVEDKLISHGVPVYSSYGSTEAGAVTAINPSNRSPSDSSFIEFSDQTDPRFVEQHDAEGSCALIFVECDGHKPFLYNCEIDGKRAYNTKDLVVPHPTNKGLWKFIGRLDDQIILLIGEKVNPGPMEDEIAKSPVVQNATIFGRERNQTGVLIELTPDAQSRILDAAGRAELVEEIWPYIEKANATSPTHARLDKWAIVFTHPDRPLPHTPKGTVPRSAAIKLYQVDIEAMYASIEKGEEVDTTGPSDWTEENATKWLKDYVGGLLGRELDAEGDLFQQGLDSLTATLLARTLKSALHRAPDSNVQRVGDKVNQQTVFAKPSIKQLVQHIATLSSDDGTSNPADIHKAALESIKAMIQKHTPNRPSKSPRVQHPSAERIVLTGTTGALGSHLLAQLLQNEKVERVWALNRRSGNADGMQRQRASFEDKNLDVKLLESSKLILAEADLTDRKLGLDDRVLEEIRASATAIVHNAWQINFNLSLQSFEPSIMGAENLINLAFDSVHNPRFVFTSSISAAGVGSIGLSLPEEYIQLENVATGLGYGESKFVTEKMLESAQSSGLETCVVRLGQLTGDKISGSWSPTDWVPSLVASSLSIGYLPDALGSVSWTPLDDAANTVIDACLSREALLSPVIHCAHPRPVPWSRMMRMFSHIFEERGNKRLGLMPLAEWNQKVVEAASAISLADEAFKRYPSTKIQTTVDGMTHSDEQVRGAGAPMDGEFEAGGMARMSTTKAVGLSKALEKVEPLSEEHVRAWVVYWKERGLFL
ncbi:AMP binding enzyme [Ceratobasidium sp. AG-Ba]|nr:AMP binding enzyme [Ceratobasidium sp. AG-Ba]